ncbi:hypothetical protein B0H13DRAFT_2305347 [Mycena leptocephala]|nr:hypothetical protein B0H13DRAFT_2305347 [Mycena leptocephala]
MAKDKEVQRVDDDIRDIVNGLVPAVRKRWFGYNPESSRSSKDKYDIFSSPDKPTISSSKKSKKRKTDRENDNEPEADDNNSLSDSDIEIVSTKKPSKKREASLPAADDDDDTVDMSKPPSTCSERPQTNSKPPPVKTTDLRPFEFKSNILYTDLLRILADGCQTKPRNLAVNSMKWKFDRPGNAAKKTLANEIAFKVMIKSLKDCGRDYVFSIYMLPPTVVKKELPWYNLDDVPASVKSVHEQIASIDAASSQDLNELLEEYPIDNNPLFPGKCIYHNETGYFDLTDIRLRIWADAKVSSRLSVMEEH